VTDAPPVTLHARFAGGVHHQRGPASEQLTARGSRAAPWRDRETVDVDELFFELERHQPMSSVVDVDESVELPRDGEGRVLIEFCEPVPLRVERLSLAQTRPPFISMSDEVSPRAGTMKAT
jgi:hypothetical protein